MLTKRQANGMITNFCTHNTQNKSLHINTRYHQVQDLESWTSIMFIKHWMNLCLGDMATLRAWWNHHDNSIFVFSTSSFVSFSSILKLKLKCTILWDSNSFFTFPPSTICGTSIDFGCWSYFLLLLKLNSTYQKNHFTFMKWFQFLRIVTQNH